MTDQKTRQMTKKQYALQFIKFTLFSISAGLIQIGSFTLLGLLFPDNGEAGAYWVKYLISLVLSVVYNFTINRKFTFKSANNYTHAMLKVLGYYAVFTPLSTWWGNALTNIGWNEYVVLLGTMVVNFVTEFLFDRFVVFRSSINTNKLAQRDREKKLSEGENLLMGIK
jgi:putative flippase GtrA